MPIQLIVVTPEGEAFSGSVDQVVLPGSEGRFGVLQSHERYLAPLSGGVMEIQSGGSSTFAAVSDGFAEVTAQQVVVLVDSCKRREEIDIAAAAEARDSARSRIDQLTLSEEDQVKRLFLESLVACAEGELEVGAK